MPNISKALKKKRDAEERLRRTSPQAVFSESGGSQTYITIQEITEAVEQSKTTWELLTNGDSDNPELLFADGDVLYVEVL